jgi:small subunit ribosomal protein S16
MSRAGHENLPFFRIVLTEKSKAAKHGYKKVLGFYNPLTKEIKLDKEEAAKYISTGAQYSASLKKILERKGML